MPADRRTPRRRFGDFGERLAAAHLEAHGYRILDRNWSVRDGEIDIVATRGDDLVFVEVRSRRGRGLGAPEESITARKFVRVRTAAAAYLLQHPEAPPNHRIDLVVVELDGRGRLLRVEQIENAVEGE